MLLDDSLDLGENVPGRQDELLRDGANLLVPFACEGDAFGAELVGALAKKQDRLVVRASAGRLGNGFVDIAEDRFVRPQLLFASAQVSISRAKTDVDVLVLPALCELAQLCQRPSVGVGGRLLEDE